MALFAVVILDLCIFFFFSSRRRHTRCSRDWSSDVCSSDLSPSRLRSSAVSPIPVSAMINTIWPSPEGNCADTVTVPPDGIAWIALRTDRKSTRLNSSHGYISYAVFCLKKKKKKKEERNAQTDIDHHA